MISIVFYWISKILKYWHLFVAAIIVAAGMAYLRNQYWTPVYRTAFTMKIEDAEKRNEQAGDTLAVQAHRHIHNQLVLYQSHNLLNKTIDHLGVGTELYEKTIFKQINHYKSAAIEIFENYTNVTSYSMEFNIQGLTDSTYVISYSGDHRRQAFRLTGTYGELLLNPLFIHSVQKTDVLKDQPHYN
jgi:uncharacterized protein involved in exopolysaccharide biosynthesis